MNTESPALEWLTTEAGRSVYVTPDQLAIENAKDARVLTALHAAPSFPDLLKAYHRFRRDMNKYDYNPAVIERKPWDTLVAHSGVMNAKSARAVTLRNLAGAVFRESGLPRSKPGAFRGSDGLDWDRVTAS